MRQFVAALCAVTVSGCFFPADRGRVVENRLDGLAADNLKLKSELAETRSKLDDASTQLQTALDQLDRATRTTGANMGVKVDTALQDVAVLRGQLESQQVKMQELEAKLAAQPTPAAVNTPAEPKKEELKRPDDPKEFLKLADEKAKGGDQDLARKLYTEFMKKFPRDDGVGADERPEPSEPREDRAVSFGLFPGRIEASIGCDSPPEGGRRADVAVVEHVGR